MNGPLSLASLFRLPLSLGLELIQHKLIQHAAPLRVGPVLPGLVAILLRGEVDAAGEVERKQPDILASFFLHIVMSPFSERLVACGREPSSELPNRVEVVQDERDEGA